MAASHNFSIRSRPFGRGNAGRIALTTPILDIEGGDVSTVAFGAGRAGDITINAAHLVVAGEGASQMGSNGGNVTIRANQMVVNRGFVRANAFGGDGGQINIIASGAFLADATTCASVECLNASSDLGISDTVEVQSPVTNLSEAMTPLSLSFGPDIAVLRDRCTPRLREGNVTRLMDRSRDRVATHPDGLSPRRLYQPTRATGLPRHETGWYAASVESDSVNHLRLGETMGWRHYQQNTHLPPLCH